MRAWVGILVAAFFLAAMFYVTRSETTVECSVCIQFNGVENCATVSGPDQAQAMMQATSTACAPISSGVSDGMKCTRTPPRSARCSG